MKDNLYPVGIRLSSLESSFLTKIAIENMLVKKNGEPSLGLAVKHILKEKMIENEHKNQQDTKGDPMIRIERMIEEINITIPHLVYSTLMSAQSSIYNLTDDVVAQIKEVSVKQSSKICGQIQEEQYEHLYISNDTKQMKTIPIEEDKNKWKSK